MLLLTPPPPVGPRLKVARARAGLSWSQLAKKSGVGRRTIAEIEAGQGWPNLKTVWLLAQATGQNAAWLSGFAEEEAQERSA